MKFKPGCHERNDNTARYKILSMYKCAIRLPRIATKRVLLSNEIAAQITTPGCLVGDNGVNILPHSWMSLGTSHWNINQSQTHR